MRQFCLFFIFFPWCSLQKSQIIQKNFFCTNTGKTFKQNETKKQQIFTILHWMISEIKVVIDDMKTKVLLTEIAKWARINMQISIKIIVAKIHTIAWPKLDRNTLLFSTFKIAEFCSVCRILQYLINTCKTRMKYYFTISKKPLS